MTSAPFTEPPMTEDWVQLHDGPIEIGAVFAFVGAPAAGGVAVFLGTTREDAHADGRRLVALDYEAYAPMALKQMRELAQRARARWPIVRLALLHRTGRVELGRPSVIIAVSTPHRADAFEACRWLIDTLKEETPIWKKEVWEDGAATWVHPAPSHGVTGTT